MTADEEEIDNVFVAYEFETQFVRIIGAHLMPTVFTVRIDVHHNPDAEDSDVDAAFAKIRFWFDNVVSKCVVFARHNNDALSMVVDMNGNNRTSNMLMLTPEDPTDEHLAALFQSKMTALAADAVVFGVVEAKSTNLHGLSFCYTGNASQELEYDGWLGERNYFDLPWWRRDDSSTLDVMPSDNADLSQKPGWAYSLDFLKQLNRPTETGQETGTVVPFRPTVIDGGKSD